MGVFANHPPRRNPDSISVIEIFHQLTLKSIGVRESTHSPSMKFRKTRAWVSLREWALRRLP